MKKLLAEVIMCILFTFYESEYTFKFSEVLSFPPIFPVFIYKLTRQQEMPVLASYEQRVTSLPANHRPRKCDSSPFNENKSRTASRMSKHM